MKTHSVRISLEPRVLLKKIFKLERSGRYYDALTLLREDPDDIASPIDVSELEQDAAAEMQLRYGSLVGFHGHDRLIAGSQERSKDILMAAREAFQSLGRAEKVAECENHIAISYWRTAEFREADAWLDEAISHNISPASFARLHNHVIRSCVLLSQRKHEENIAFCRSVENDLLKQRDVHLSAGLFSNMGISFKDLSKPDEALDYFLLARSFQQRSTHRLHLAMIENNLALLYKNGARFRLAHGSADNAISIYKRLKDKSREGSSFETKAQISLAECKYDEALIAIDRSITLLRKSENLAYLAESLMTRSRILHLLGDFQNAVFSMIEAVNITERQSGEPAARLLIDEFETTLKEIRPDTNVSKNHLATDIELILPRSLDRYKDYKGVWINNSHLENIGIGKGSLAVIAVDKIDRGDLVAIEERDSGSVICGRYDADFGMVCIESVSGHPQLYDDKDIVVLGKIVGVCYAGKENGGKMIVEPIA